MSKTKLKRVLAFGAHPDDIEIFMLGTLLSLKAAGWQVGWVVATDGAAANGAPDRELVKIREAEALEVGRIFECDITLLGFPDGGLRTSIGVSDQIQAILNKEQPDLVLVHHLDDYHPDHRALAEFVTALRPVGSAFMYAEPMIGVGGHPSLLVDITPHFGAKLKGLGCHASQIPNPDFLEIWNRFRGLQFADRNVKYAEGFVLDTHLRSGNILKTLASDLNIAMV